MIDNGFLKHVNLGFCTICTKIPGMIFMRVDKWENKYRPQYVFRCENHPPFYRSVPITQEEYEVRCIMEK